MSGIYIPGMEMPKTWRDCLFSNGAAKCKLDNMELCGLCYRQRCPLIPVPDHGRLIDADAVYKRLQKQAMSVWGDRNPRYQIVLAVMDAIRFAPTVIPADPAKEGEG